MLHICFKFLLDTLLADDAKRPKMAKFCVVRFSLTNNSAIWIQHVCKHHVKRGKQMQQHTQAQFSIHDRFEFRAGSPFSPPWKKQTNKNKATKPASNKLSSAELLMYSTKRTRKYSDLPELYRPSDGCFATNSSFVSNCGLTRAAVRNWLNSLWLVLSALEER